MKQKDRNQEDRNRRAHTLDSAANSYDVDTSPELEAP